MSIHQTSRILASHQRDRIRNRQQCVLLRTATEIGLSTEHFSCKPTTLATEYLNPSNSG